ncbi:semaphorin-5A-like [Globicephala melas]|uniref:semaphorin-5A-like n=1 Tax=Globicephala melas TaxID=9731 RepID=UPI00293D34DB|nr:semaphorin-5A-like [Globicephala melas]
MLHPWISWFSCGATCGFSCQMCQVYTGQNHEERYCNEHLLCPPHMFWTGWGPWERCTAQCGGGIQARRRTCENGPDCAGCSVGWPRSAEKLERVCGLHLPGWRRSQEEGGALADGPQVLGSQVVLLSPYRRKANFPLIPSSCDAWL